MKSEKNKIANKVISTIIEREGLLPAQFANALGVSPTTMYELQSGKITSISAKLAILIHKKFPRYSLDYILTGEEEMLNTVRIPTYDFIHHVGTDCGLEPNIQCGDHIAVKLNDEYVMEGHPYLVELNTGELILRRVYTTKDGFRLVSSDNDKFPDMNLYAKAVVNLYRIVAQIRTT